MSQMLEIDSAPAVGCADRRAEIFGKAVSSGQSLRRLSL